jgi:hypothetical protein
LPRTNHVPLTVAGDSPPFAVCDPYQVQFTDMQMEDVEAVLRVLRALLSRGPSEIDTTLASEQLQQCLAVLRRETGFKPIAPGEPVPLLSYELVQAKDSIETAIQLLADGDLAAALEQSRSALSDVQSALSR